MTAKEVFKILQFEKYLLEVKKKTALGIFEIFGIRKSFAIFPQACLCKRVVLVVFVASVHARAFWKALFTLTRV